MMFNLGDKSNENNSWRAGELASWRVEELWI